MMKAPRAPDTGGFSSFFLHPPITEKNITLSIYCCEENDRRY